MARLLISLMAFIMVVQAIENPHRTLPDYQRYLLCFAGCARDEYGKGYYDHIIAAPICARKCSESSESGDAEAPAPIPTTRSTPPPVSPAPSQSIHYSGCYNDCNHICRYVFFPSRCLAQCKAAECPNPMALSDLEYSADDHAEAIDNYATELGRDTKIYGRGRS